MERTRFRVFGAPETGQYLKVCSPYNGEAIGEVELADEQTLDFALDNAARGAELVRALPAHARAKILYDFSAAIEVQRDKLAQLIASEGGKPLKDARVEVTRAINTAKMSGDEALQLGGSQIAMDRAPGSESNTAFTIRVPIGPVLAISAFNHPVNLICHQVCPAIAGGNSVILKPASSTPLSALALADLLIGSGLPPEALSVVPCRGSMIERAARDPRVRFVSFIGSEAVGWKLRGIVAPGTRVSLELGGIAAAIVEPDADLAQCVADTVRAGYYHAGQVCVSTQIVYLHQKIADQFLAAFVPKVEALRVGDPLDPQTEVGPLISPAERDRVAEIVDEAISKGARCLIGGRILAHDCYAPTIMTDLKPRSRVLCEEVFGPVVAVMVYDDLDAVVQELNHSRYSFQTAVYTQNIDTAMRLAKEIETKALMVNQSTAFRVDWMPFGGAKASGLGTGGTKHALLELTEERLIVINSPT